MSDVNFVAASRDILDEAVGLLRSDEVEVVKERRTRVGILYGVLVGGGD